jgi:ribosomal protein L31E
MKMLKKKKIILFYIINQYIFKNSIIHIITSIQVIIWKLNKSLTTK